MGSGWLNVDWHGVFVPTHSLVEIAVRGTIMYLLLFFILRFAFKRQSGGLGIADLLVIVLIADAAQNGMVGDYNSVTEGAVIVFTIVFWNYALDWLGYRVPAIQRLIRPPPLRLIENGRMLTANMRRESITREELLSQLREQGIEDPAEVKLCHIEGDGRLSIIKSQAETNQGSPDRMRF